MPSILGNHSSCGCTASNVLSVELFLFVFAAGKLDFSIPGAQTSDQNQCHNLNKSKHGLPCFVVFVSFSAKSPRSFPKQ